MRLALSAVIVAAGLTLGASVQAAPAPATSPLGVTTDTTLVQMTMSQRRMMMKRRMMKRDMMMKRRMMMRRKMMRRM